MHAYFQTLAAMGECLAAYSLRDQAQIEEYRRGKKHDTHVTYDPSNDSDPRKQDAAKILIPEGKVNLPTQVRLPIPPAPQGLLVTWDAWWGNEFAFSNTKIGQYKAFQLASSGRIWTEIRAVFKAAQNKKNASQNAVAMVDVRSYGGKSGGYSGPNVTNNQPLSPQAASFGIKPETWTRYWVLLTPAENGFFEFSFWMADESRDAIRLHDRLLIKPTASGRWDQFWLEYNTSSPNQPRRIGPLVSYARNIVILRPPANLQSLFERPRR